MTLPLSKLLATFESLWPLAGAEEWDRPGLTTGNPEQEISKVLLCVDVTLEVLSEAKAQGCELIISHHPILLKEVSYLAEDQLKGSLIGFALKHSIATFAAHTNADVVVGGVSDVLATQLGISKPLALVPTGDNAGHGRIGKIEKPLKLADFANFVASKLPATSAPVRVAGDPDRLVKTVAVVGGAGDSFIQAAKQARADVLVTSDLRHHVSLDAITDPKSAIALIDVSHFAAESLWLAPAAKTLASLLPEVSFVVSQVGTDPWSMSVMGSGNSEG